MYRQIITPENTELVLHIPASMVGKEIKITAEETEHPASQRRMSKRRMELEKFYSRYSFDVSKLKLTRDEANER